MRQVLAHQRSGTAVRIALEPGAGVQELQRNQCRRAGAKTAGLGFTGIVQTTDQAARAATVPGAGMHVRLDWLWRAPRRFPHCPPQGGAMRSRPATTHPSAGLPSKPHLCPTTRNCQPSSISLRRIISPTLDPGDDGDALSPSSSPSSRTTLTAGASAPGSVGTGGMVERERAGPLSVSQWTLLEKCTDCARPRPVHHPPLKPQAGTTLAM